MLAAEFGGAGEQFVLGGDRRAPAQPGVERAQQRVLAARRGCEVGGAVDHSIVGDEHVPNCRPVRRHPTSARGQPGVLPISSTPGAVPAELDHALQARRPVGVHQRDGVTGAFRRLDAVEPVGVGHAGRDVLAEMEQHGAGVRVIGVGVGLDDDRRQLCAFVVGARQRFGTPRLPAARVAGQVGDGLGDLGRRQVHRTRIGRRSARGGAA